ncbi:MAG TPA: GNAT family N-acetyltransferase [Thermomicrobiales bacterium]|jgi:ribosomal protein S18 acetylase RimI-like enzyme
MHESDLTDLSAADLAAAFNLVYTDYVIPFSLSEAAMRQHVAAHAIALDRSLLWRDDTGAIVGLGALAVRGERGWVGGFGLAPSWRGRGLSGALMEALLDRARGAGLRRVQLEVITTNDRAIRTYERAGFRRTRELLLLSADASAVPASTATVTEVSPATLLAGIAGLALPDLAWQREPASLLALPDLQGLALGPSTSPRAFVVFTTPATAVQIQALVGDSTESLVALIGALSARFPGRSLRLVNEPEESPVLGVLLAAGWRYESLRQYEMVCTL